MGQQIKMIKTANGQKSEHWIDESLIDRVLGMGVQTRGYEVTWEIAPEHEQMVSTPAAKIIPGTVKPLHEQLEEKTDAELNQIIKDKGIKVHPAAGRKKKIDLILNFAAL